MRQLGQAALVGQHTGSSTKLAFQAKGQHR